MRWTRRGRDSEALRVVIVHVQIVGITTLLRSSAHPEQTTHVLRAPTAINPIAHCETARARSVP